MLTKKQFDLLVSLERNGKQTQRALANDAGMSLGGVNKTLTSLLEEGYVTDGLITPKGLEALEPYRVKRAVFIAAGFGSRLVPITLNTPKPLVRVKGKRMIETLLDAVVAAGIEEIYLIRGYLGEQFDQLLYKYPTIRFIENPAYNEANNISSAMCARYLLANAYVFEADLLLYKPSLITKYQYESNYLGVPVKMTDDWCFTSKNGYITGLGVGGTDCHHMFGVSYWSAEDGARLAEHIEQVYHSPGGKERYWDQVALEYFASEYRIAIRECSFEDIVEVDTYRELKQLDETYRVDG
ncbi:MAG: winged helix-turn-helix transcriptional regulator [Ruminococcaceae bacterium]|nr:winged helix-turn-helix transcriptional regulator [Oscillospiraceae bacterium]